jgi:DNA-binding Xre family transcriptional regulator
MGKDLKVGVHRGDGDPEFKWNVVIVDLAFQDAKEFLDDTQYEHVAEQVRELARETDPTHAVTQRVSAVEDLFELKDKGGPLGKINVRVFFVMDKPRFAIVVLGAIFKQNDGKTPFGDKKRMKRRKRKYFAGDYGEPEINGNIGGNEHGRNRKREEICSELFSLSRVKRRYAMGNAMSASELVKVSEKRNVSVGDAALTMAIGIVIERVSRLSTEDKQDLYELLKGLGGTKDPEEIEAIRVAMREILDQEPSGVRGMDLADVPPRSEKLQRWVNYVAAKVQELRKAKGMTQMELAEKSGLPQSHISRIESAKLSPSRVTLEKICDALGCSLTEIDPSA